MMARKLFAVEDTFTIQQRGPILAPGVQPEDDERFRTGDALRLVRPDGSEVFTSIGGIEFFHPDPLGRFAILVPLAKSEIPIGTEVWSLPSAG